MIFPDPLRTEESLDPENWDELRVAITNHRSRREDFDLLVRETRRIGAELARD